MEAISSALLVSSGGTGLIISIFLNKAQLWLPDAWLRLRNTHYSFVHLLHFILSFPEICQEMYILPYCFYLYQYHGNFVSTYCIAIGVIVAFLSVVSDQISRSVVSGSATPWIAARQASLSITNSSHLILCRPLLLLPPIPPLVTESNPFLFNSGHISWLCCCQYNIFSGAVPYSLQDLSSLTRDPTQASTVKAMGPNHATTREFPQYDINVTGFKKNLLNWEVFWSLILLGYRLGYHAVLNWKVCELWSQIDMGLHLWSSSYQLHVFETFM